MSQRLDLSVILCTHNPDRAILRETLGCLARQTLERHHWELLVIDNASSPPLTTEICAGFDARIVREERLGLTEARLRGLAESASGILVYLDDDNLIEARYLENARSIMESEPRIGALGGRITPRVEGDAPPYLAEMLPMLACRDLGGERLTAAWSPDADAPRVYPSCSPVGAGMVVRRAAMESYARQLDRDAARRRLDRAGRSLASAGDNDLVMTVLEDGWQVAYDPSLSMIHVLPRRRLSREYLARLAEASNRTWVEVLHRHGVSPWRRIPGPLLPFLRLRYYLSTRAWADDPSYIRWRGLCGRAEGRAAIR